MDNLKISCHPRHNFFRHLMAILILVLLAACRHNDDKTSNNVMITLSSDLQPLFENVKTICFGHFLLELPNTATVIYGPTEVEGTIFFYSKQAAKLDEHLANQLAEIETDRKFLLEQDILKLPLFGKVIDGISSGQKISFGSKDQIHYSIYSFIPIESDLFIQEFSSLPGDNYLPTINLIAKQLRLRADNDIPAESGMCIEGGFVASNNKYERATLGIRLKEFPDVHISIDAHKNLDYLPVGSNPVELRKQAQDFAEADGLGAVFASTKILRQGRRQLGIWSGEELALRTPPYKENKSVHEFRFHSMGAVNDPLLPELDIRLDSGVKDNGKGRIEPSITDEEALTLWDKIITTIRIRKPSDATPPKAAKIPLASQVTTGKVCPQAGWWECAEKRRVEGDKRRLVKSGDPMPHVWIIEKSSFWNKLIGNRRMRPVETTWSLVAYEDSPMPSPLAG